MTKELHDSERELRRRLVKWTIVILIIGALAVLFTDSFTTDIVSWTLASEDDFPTRFTLFMVMVAVVTLAPVIGIAAYIWLLARATGAEGRYPPSGFALVQGARPLEDALAVRRANILSGLAALLLVAGAGAGYFFWRIWALLLASGPASGVA